MLVGGLADALEDGRTLAALDEGRISILANGLGGVRVDVLEENRAENERRMDSLGYFMSGKVLGR